MSKSAWTSSEAGQHDLAKATDQAWALLVALQDHGSLLADASTAIDTWSGVPGFGVTGAVAQLLQRENTPGELQDGDAVAQWIQREHTEGQQRDGKEGKG